MLFYFFVRGANDPVARSCRTLPFTKVILEAFKATVGYVARNLGAEQTTESKLAFRWIDFRPDRSVLEIQCVTATVNSRRSN